MRQDGWGNRGNDDETMGQHEKVFTVLLFALEMPLVIGFSVPRNAPSISLTGAEAVCGFSTEFIISLAQDAVQISLEVCVKYS